MAAGTSQLTLSPAQARLAQLPFPQPMKRGAVEETDGSSDSWVDTWFAMGSLQLCVAFSSVTVAKPKLGPETPVLYLCLSSDNFQHGLLKLPL